MFNIVFFILTYIIMSLEPRLQEYLQRKDFFDKNKLDQLILEKQYMITEQDKKLINMYFNKNIYKKKDLERNMFSDFVEIKKNSKPDATDEFRNDPRFQRLRNKVAKEKEAQFGRSDISELSRHYDLYNNPQDNKEEDYFDKAFPSHNLDTDSFNESKFLLKQPQNEYQYHHKKEQHVTPKIHYNERVYNSQYDSYTEHKPTLDNIVGDIGSYRNKINKSYNFNSDADFGGVIFNTNPCKEGDYMQMYGKVPEMTGSNLNNVDIETYIKFGSPSSKAKSLGFENPVEHHFSYIDSDIQNPAHIINERPQLSRLSNKQSVNYKGRKIY